jgi:G3E family GTPase
MNRSHTPIPVTILTGFLGAGKTTLLNFILRSDHGLRVAVLVNDFGAINVDAELVVGVDGATISLANGCICCTIRDDLFQAAMQLLDRPAPPDYILVEASGISDPVSIALTFLLPEVREHLRLDSTITVVDAEQVFEQRKQVGGLIEEQVAAADLVVLNKIDLVGAARRAELRAWIGELVPRARVLEGSYGQVPLPLLLGVGRYRLALEPMGAQHHDHQHAHDHGRAWTSWSYVSDQPLAYKAARALLTSLP